MAVMPRGGMSGEATQCEDISSVGKTANLTLSNGSYLEVDIGDSCVTVKMPVSLSAMVVVLGDNGADIRNESASEHALDENGVAWH